MKIILKRTIILNLENLQFGDLNMWKKKNTIGYYFESYLDFLFLVNGLIIIKSQIKVFPSI